MAYFLQVLATAEGVMPLYGSVLYGEKAFFSYCLPPPPSGTWSTKKGPYRDQMSAVMSEFNISRAWVPEPVFNGRVVGPTGALKRETLAGGYELVRSTLPLEGYEIPPGDGLVSAAGGCLFIVAMGAVPGEPMRMIVSHAGRDSLIDRAKMLRIYLDQPAYGESPGTRSTRQYEGVVYAIVDTFARWGIAPEAIEMQGFYSIPAEAFLHPQGHPTFAASNRAMHYCVDKRWPGATYEVEDPVQGPCIAVSCARLFLAQARGLGVSEVFCHPEMRVDGILAHTHHPDPEMRAKRNCVLFKNTGSGFR